MKSDYDAALTKYVEDIATRQEEARRAEESHQSRMRIRATFASAQASVRMLKAARTSQLDKTAGGGRFATKGGAAQGGRFRRSSQGR